MSQLNVPLDHIVDDAGRVAPEYPVVSLSHDGRGNAWESFAHQTPSGLLMQRVEHATKILEQRGMFSAGEMNLVAAAQVVQESLPGGVKHLRQRDSREQQAAAEFLVACGEEFSLQLFGPAVHFFIAEQYLTRGIGADDDSAIKKAMQLLSPPRAAADCLSLASGWCSDVAVPAAEVASRVMRMCELLDRVRVDTVFDSVSLPQLFELHRRRPVAFPSELECAEARLTIVRASHSRLTPFSSESDGYLLPQIGTFASPSLGGSGASARVLTDTPIGLMLSCGDTPLWVTSFFPESWTSCSVVQNQPVRWYKDFENREGMLHEKQLPLVRHVRCAELMLDVSTRLLREWGFESVLVPHATERSIERFPGRYTTPDRLRPFFDDAAARTGFTPGAAQGEKQLEIEVRLPEQARMPDLHTVGAVFGRYRRRNC